MGEQIVQARGCLECHSVKERVVGPSFGEIAARYKNTTRRAYELRLTRAARTGDLPQKAASTILVARVGTYLQVRVFDADGTCVTDKTEDSLVDGPARIELIERSAKEAVAEASSLSVAERQRWIELALVATGLAPESAHAVLAAKIKHGGKGNWTAVTGGVPMPPHARLLTESEIETVVAWILGL